MVGTVGTGANATPGATPAESAGTSLGIKYQFDYEAASRQRSGSKRVRATMFGKNSVVSELKKQVCKNDRLRARWNHLGSSGYEFVAKHVWRAIVTSYDGVSLTRKWVRKYIPSLLSRAVGWSIPDLL